MVANPFRCNLTFRNNATGRIFPVAMTISDVAAEGSVMSDGQAYLFLPTGRWTLIDAVCDEAGADTTKLEIYANHLSSGYFVYYSQNQLTTIGRQFQVAPLQFAGAVPLRFVQRA